MYNIVPIYVHTYNNIYLQIYLILNINTNVQYITEILEKIIISKDNIINCVEYK